MVLFVDLSNHYARCFFGKLYECKEDYDYAKFRALDSLFAYLNKFNPHEVVIACDSSKKYWRKHIYEDYKGDRELKRKAIDVDWDEYYRVLNDLKADLRNVFKFKVLDVPHCEADDVIGVLAPIVGECVILSNDKDYIQLLKYSDIKIFNPIRLMYTTNKDPEYTLKTHILMGDKGDNIPSVKPRVGIKTAQRIVNEGMEDWMAINGVDVEEAYERNRKLIAFSEIPNKIRKLIVDEYENYKYPSENIKMFDYFLHNGFRDFVSRFEEIKNGLRSIRRTNFGF